MLVEGNDAIINLNLLETHGKLGLAPRVNLVALGVSWGWVWVTNVSRNLIIYRRKPRFP